MSQEVIKSTIVPIIYLLSTVLFIFGIKRLSKVKTARQGNTLAAVGMLFAIVGALLELLVKALDLRRAQIDVDPLQVPHVVDRVRVGDRRPECAVVPVHRVRARMVRRIGLKSKRITEVRRSKRPPALKA